MNTDMDPGTRSRPGWMTALAGLAILVAAIFILYLIFTVIGLLD